MGLAFLFALIGFAALALAMRRHHRDLFGEEPSQLRQMAFRVVGALGLATSYGRIWRTWGFIEGTIDWSCLASLAAIVIAFILTGTHLLYRTTTRNRTATPQEGEAERENV